MSPSRFPYLSCDIFPKSKIYNVFYRLRGTFFYPSPLVLPCTSPKRGKFGWYIKNIYKNLLILPSPYITFAPKITFLPWLEMGTFYQIWPPSFCPFIPPKQGKFEGHIKTCHLCISPPYVTLAPKIIFIPWFMGRWARFYQFWPPFSPFSPKNKVNLSNISKVVICASYLPHMWNFLQE